MMNLRMTMSPLWTLAFLASFFFTFDNLSEAHSDQKKLPSAVVVGTVYCDTCFNQGFSKSSHFISGATVAVECRDSTNSRPTFHELVKTNEHGEFKVHLPFSVSKHVKKIKECSVKLINSSEAFCAVASTATSSSLRLKSRKEGTHIFSAGFFTFKPLKQPEVCDQKPSMKNSKKIKAVKSSISDPNNPAFFPPIRDPPTPDLPPLGQTYLPPLPSLPNLPNLPNLPTLPPLPGVPYNPPVPTKAQPKESRLTSEFSNKQAVQRRTSAFFPFPPILPPNPLLPPPSILPPNPLLPPPSILPPNPLLPPPSVVPPIFPSPPPSVLPPLFPSPPPSPILPPILPSPPSPPSSGFPPLIPSPGTPPAFNIPPLLPGLTPSPPPPSPPFFPIPFPFRPIPGFPGVPPAVPSSKPKTSHP